MKNLFPKVVVFLFLQLFCWHIVNAQGSTVSGFIFDFQRKPLSEIQVELMNEVNAVLTRTRTDNSGRYFFRGLSPGRFYVRVLTLGTNFEEQTQEIEIAGIGISGRSLGDNIQKDFYLNQKKQNPGKVENKVVFTQDIPEEAKVVFNRAVSDLENKRVENGIKELENALKIFPDYFLALERLGLERIKQQKYEDAKKLLSEAVKIFDRSFNTWYGLGYANYSLSLSQEAVSSAEKAVSLNSGSIEGLLLWGVSLRQDKQYEKAEQKLKQAEKLALGKIPDIHWNLALLYAHNLGRYGDAANELELYLKSTPNVANKEEVKKLIKYFRTKAQSTN